jgi:hypothetical protein
MGPLKTVRIVLKFSNTIKFFLNRKDIYCSNFTSPAKPEGLSAGAHAAVKQGCSTA